MDYNEVLDFIQDVIAENHNNEITANALRPVLVEMLNFTRDNIGLLEDLATDDKSNIVAAINEVLTAVNESNNEAVVVHEGEDNPNTVSPPVTFKIGDMYSQQLTDGSPVALFIYTGLTWYKVDIPLFEQVVAMGGNLNVSQLVNDGDGTSPYSTVDYLNGFNLTANQSTQEIYLENPDGEIIATLSVAFLNNEGTTFFYNEATGNLELKDDEGNVLSTIPVSSFISNVVNSANWNVTTPYVLEFRDSEGNLKFNVTFTINNIQGLQAALDDKLDKIAGGTTGQYYDGTGALRTFNVDVQNSIIGSDNGSDTTPISNTSTVRQSIWSLVRQSVSKLNINQTIDGVKSWLKGHIFTYGGATGTNVHLRKLNEMFSYVNSQPTVNGSIQIRLPIQAGINNMWQMTVQIIEYQAATGTKPPIELIITGYTDANSHATVTSVNPNAITQVRFGRNLANDKSVIIIDGTGTWTYPKVIIKELIWHHSSNGTFLENPANYSLTISTDETDYTNQVTILAANFSRDAFLRNAANLNAGTIAYARLPFTSTDVANWNASVPTSHGNTKASVVYGAGGESLNSLPKGTYTAAVSTLAADKPFTSVGGLISVGDLTNGYQILGSRTGTEFWFRPYSTTYGAWVKMYSSIDVNGLYMPLGTNIPTSSNLDTYQTTGHFNCISNAIAASGTNFPSPVAGTLTVNQSANAIVYQRYHTAGGAENNVYVRILASGVWTAWNKFWGSKDFTSTNVTNWNTAFTNSHTHANKTVLDGIAALDITNWNAAYNRGDFRDYGLARTTLLAPSGDDIDNPDLPSGIWSVGDTFGSPLIDSFGAVLQMRSGLGGDSVAQVCVKADASGNNELYIRSCDDEGLWNDWARVWISEDFEQSDIDAWNAALAETYREVGWGTGLNDNGLFTGNIVSVTDARIVAVDSTTATNIPSGASNGVAMILAANPLTADKPVLYFEYNDAVWVGRRAGLAMNYKKLAYEDDIYALLGATHANSTMPDLSYLNTNFPSAPDGFEYRCPLTTPRRIFKKCANGDWLYNDWTTAT